MKKVNLAPGGLVVLWVLLGSHPVGVGGPGRLGGARAVSGRQRRGLARLLRSPTDLRPGYNDIAVSGNDSGDDSGLGSHPDAEETRTLSQLADHPRHERWSGGHLSPGQSFGHFEIQRLLGAGGMGEVYEAFDHDTGRYVALKILSETLGDPEDRKRFLREGQLAARVSHPNSIYVYGTEEIDGNPVIIMELAALSMWAPTSTRWAPRCSIF